MSKYLVVTHQTALSPDLQRKVRALVAEDPAAEFAVLVPEAPGWRDDVGGRNGRRGKAARRSSQDAARRDGASARLPYGRRGAGSAAGDQPTSCSRTLATIRSSSAHCRRAFPAG